MHKTEPIPPEKKQPAPMPTLAKEAAAQDTHQLADYLKASGRDIDELYRSYNSWTTILRRAGLPVASQQKGETDLLKRVHAFLHVDDRERAEAYDRLLRDDAPSFESLNPRDQAFARMLFFNLWDKAGGYNSYAEGLDALREQRAFRSELRQVLAYVSGRAQRSTIPLEGAHAHMPLKVHARYNRSEILAAMDVARIGGLMPGSFAQGVLWDARNRTDALLVTLEKNEKHFSPTVRYNDYPLSPTRFHWESQNSTAATSPTGLRYQEHAQRETHILIFMRRRKNTRFGKAQPWMLLGPATFEQLAENSSEPMRITWALHHQLPADVWAYASTYAQTPTSDT